MFRFDKLHYTKRIFWCAPWIFDRGELCDVDQYFMFSLSLSLFLLLVHSVRIYGSQFGRCVVKAFVQRAQQKYKSLYLSNLLNIGDEYFQEKRVQNAIVCHSESANVWFALHSILSTPVVNRIRTATGRAFRISVPLLRAISVVCEEHLESPRWTQLLIEVAPPNWF